jgi:hypothetical protein
MSYITDDKVTQLKTWLDSYLNIARSYLNQSPSSDLLLYFLCNPPEMITLHCSTANYKTLNLKNGEFLYNGPSSVSNGLIPQIYCMKNGALVPVSTYSDFFSATLISVNPEYIVGKTPEIKAQPVVVYSFVDKNGDELNGPLTMPVEWVPTNSNELVTKQYVDQLRLELEARLGLLESKV